MHSNQLQHYAPGEKRKAWLTILLQTAAVTVLSGGLTYLATNRQELVHAADAVVRAVAPQAAAPSTPPVEDARVRYANPFDATEVFEFPAGTSEAEARREVADTLMRRAHERQHVLSKRPVSRDPGPQRGAGVKIS